MLRIAIGSSGSSRSRLDLGLSDCTYPAFLSIIPSCLMQGPSRLHGTCITTIVSSFCLVATVYRRGSAFLHYRKELHVQRSIDAERLPLQGTHASHLSTRKMLLILGTAVKNALLELLALRYCLSMVQLSFWRLERKPQRQSRGRKWFPACGSFNTSGSVLPAILFPIRHHLLISNKIVETWSKGCFGQSMTRYDVIIRLVDIATSWR